MKTAKAIESVKTTRGYQCPQCKGVYKNYGSTKHDLIGYTNNTKITKMGYECYVCAVLNDAGNRNKFGLRKRGKLLAFFNKLF